MKTTNILIGARTSVNPDDISILKAEANYTIINFRNGQKRIVATSLKYLEELFEPHNFYRVHKSFMVNLAHIKTYLPTHNRIEMIDNQKVLVSRRKANGLKNHLHPQL